MSRRPNPTLDEIARGPRTAPGECEAWLVARAVEELRGELDGLRSTVLSHINEASPPARATVERLPRGLSVEAHETLVRSENRASDAIAELADARRELDEALRQLATQAEEHERVVRERDAAREERRMVGGWYNSCERFRTGLKAERDALQEQLAESRAALARIAEYQADPGRSFHQDYVNVKGIAKDALATATTEESTDA